MKILKPGKVEQRKFVCRACGCVFVATEQEKYLAHDDYYQSWTEVQCPCGVAIKWSSGEPYEAPTPTQTDRERFAELIDNAPVYRSAPWEMKRLQIADYLISSGATFKEE